MVLPTGYTRLQYVTGSANAYTIVPIHLTDEDVVKAKVETRANCNLFGCYTGSDATDNFSLYAGSKYYIRVDGQLNSSVTATKNTVVEYELSKDGLLEDGVQVASFSGVPTFTTSTYFYVGWLDNATSAKFTGDFYSIEVVGKFCGIPAKRDSDGVAGFYDTVTSTFYASNGSAWTAGPEAQKIAPFWLLMRRRAMMPQTTITSFVPGYDGYTWVYYDFASAGSHTLFYDISAIDGNIIIDGVSMSPSKSYTFGSAGRHLVKYKETTPGSVPARFNSVTEIAEIYFRGNPAAGVRSYYFRGSETLLDLGDGVTELSADSFNGSANLSDLRAPAVTRFGKSVGSTSASLTRIVLPSVVELYNNGNKGIFEGNSVIQYFEVGENISVIPSYLFYKSSCNTFVIRATTPPSNIQSNTFSSWNTAHKIYVPYSADHSVLAAYQSATVWSGQSANIYELNQDGTIPA